MSLLPGRRSRIQTWPSRDGRSNRLQGVRDIRVRLRLGRGPQRLADKLRAHHLVPPVRSETSQRRRRDRTIYLRQLPAALLCTPEHTGADEASQNARILRRALADAWGPREVEAGRPLAL